MVPVVTPDLGKLIVDNGDDLTIPKLIDVTILGVGRNTISLHVLHLTVPALAGREGGKCFQLIALQEKLETFWPTHLHSAVHAAVSGRCVLPAVRPVQEAPVAVVPKVALVRPPLIKISYILLLLGHPPLGDLLHLLVPHHLHHVGRLGLPRLLSLRNPG